MTEGLQKVILAQGLLLAAQTVLYFVVEALEGKPHQVERTADHAISFVPEWVFFYVLWFPLIAVFPLCLFFVDPELYAVYFSAIVCDIVLSTLIYLIFPTGFSRPEPPESFSGRVLRLVYRGSYRGLNCAPSMHCSMCFLVMFAVLSCGAMGAGQRMLFAAVSLLIIPSTLFTKQHALLDALSAFPTALLCWAVGRRLPFAALLAWLS